MLNGAGSPRQAACGPLREAGPGRPPKAEQKARRRNCRKAPPTAAGLPYGAALPAGCNGGVKGREAAAGAPRPGRDGSPAPPPPLMWLQQRLKGLPGLLSSSWARRLLLLLLLLLVAYWYLGAGRARHGAGRGAEPRGAAALCLQAAAGPWRAQAERGDALPLPEDEAGDGPGLALAGNGFLLLDVAAGRLWVSAAGSGGGPALPTEYPALVRLRALGGRGEARAAQAALRDGAVRRVRCVQTGAGPGGAGECVTVREEVVAHRSRPHLYLQRIRIANPTERVATFEASAPASAPSLSARFATSLEKVEERQFLLSSGRLLLPGSPKVVLMVVAAKKLVSRVQVAPKSTFDETVWSVVYTSEPIEVSRLEETFSKLRESAKKEMLEVMQMGVEDLFQEHQQTWSDLFISGKESDPQPPSSCFREELNAW